MIYENILLAAAIVNDKYWNGEWASFIHRNEEYMFCYFITNNNE